MDMPQTRWAETVDGLDIAFQEFGDGPVTILVVPAGVTHVEIDWGIPPYAAFLRQLATFARVVMFDKRGTGMSDRFTGVPDLEARMDDVRAVMDASGTDRAALLGLLDGAALAALFAATYPARTFALIFDGEARRAWAPDYPWGVSAEYDERTDRLLEIWGDETHAGEFARLYYNEDAPEFRNEQLCRSWVRSARFSATPKSFVAFDRVMRETDVRDVLPLVQTPTLVPMPSEVDDDDRESLAYIAERISGARLETYTGRWAVAYLGESEDYVRVIRRFLGSVTQEEAELDRMLATVLFTDVVSSTKRSADVGDARWKELLERHNAIVRAQLGRYRGTEVKTMGDGFLATFDGPARAVKCAQGICEAVKPLGLEVRAGCHTGEIELLGGEGTSNADVGGIAVHIGARVGALAGPSEVLVSSTVKDLVAGSGLVFEDRGEHTLKGVPEPWRLYAAVSATAV
jgi:class 3 adenylate cyclase